MNARTQLSTQITPLIPAPPDEDHGIDLLEYWDIILDHRWMIAAIALIALGLGAAYTILAKPVYEANLLIQVEDPSPPTNSYIGSATNFFDVKAATTAEIEIIRSRMVIGQAVDNLLLYIDAAPRYLPVVGSWLARRSHTLSDPGFFGVGGFVTGAEKIGVTQFDVPESLEGSNFRVTARRNGSYVLSNPKLPQPITGTVGTPLMATTPAGTLTLKVSVLDAKPGAEFDLVRRSRLSAIGELQTALVLAEKTRQSGIIDARLQNTDRVKLTRIMNEIGQLYVRQNVERKAAEAQKTLTFLRAQLPNFKQVLNQAEETYSKYRSQAGTISQDNEAQSIIAQMADLQSKLVDSQQKRVELIAHFTPEHPQVKTLDAQIAAWRAQIAGLGARVRSTPSVQRDAVRLQRDVQVNNDAYQNLRTNELQLMLASEGKIGNVRVIDSATLPNRPVKPQGLLIVPISAALGLLAGLALAIARAAFSREIRSSFEIEAQTGLSVYATIPLSEAQEKLARLAAAKQPGLHVLAALASGDPAIESLRSLRTSLQFAMIEAPNNRVLITGGTPGVGKSFVSCNFAALLASAGKRVLLIDADLRKGHLNHFFGAPRERGFSEVIAGTLSPADAIRRDVLPNLDLLTTGMLPPNPAELMITAAFSHRLEELSALYDIVLLDTAPVLAASDTLGIATQVGTILLVARAGQTQLGELLESTRRLTHAGKSANGVIFNAIDPSRRHYGSYGYKYGGYKYREYSYAQQ
jgi:tyrosine-protein kinase Etk/Wzc